MSAYYSENDPFAAAWLNELMKEGLIADGWVDTRDIWDVSPDELKGFTQCHFFAGIGIWSLALRMAGWDDDREIWTGSAPCQPFSAAGKGDGFADERHLWPAWFHLITHGKRRDVPVLGEQVAAKAGRAWFDLVSSDMETLDHGCGAVDTSAAGFGAPFIGQRLYWLASTLGCGQSGFGGSSGTQDQRNAECGEVGRLAASDSGQCNGWPNSAAGDDCGRSDAGRAQGDRGATISGSIDGLAAPQGVGCERDALRTGRFGSSGDEADCRSDRLAAPTSRQSSDRLVQRSGEHRLIAQDQGDSGDGGIPLHPVDFWRDADWLLCRDPNGARFRPVEPASFPLVDGRPFRNRLHAVRGAGNALNVSQATCFVEAVMEYLDA